MADRGQRSLIVAAVTAAALALPAGAAAELSPWLVGAVVEQSAATPSVLPSTPPTVDIAYRRRVAAPCRGRATVTLARGAHVLQRRTLRLGRDCRVRATFRVARDGSAQLRVVQHYRGRTTSARLLAPRLGSRGLDERAAAPVAPKF
jgi:hypothetical protein